ncbi:APC family permease [Streptomyces sp. SL13]|uniref:APC family permease n=1 Tax=Streptantibioticus silvisoli TaxID=2705255 RepID=A0AA90JY26_9ACTN|nr:APC family permease [Streptantibioticus silvisoli]MDI5970736.1 APC family permease [Streptantibioticus silvisoli]
MSKPEPAEAGHRLRRNLSTWGAVGLSVALLGPSMASNLNPQEPAARVGAGVPLVFLLSTVGVLLVAHGFIRMSQHMSHAGSLYGWIGAVFGRRAGFVAGWLLLGTYLAFAVTTTAGSAVFLSDFLRGTGVWPGVNWLVPAAVAFAGISRLASRPARAATRALLALEFATMGLFTAVAAVVLVKVATGGAPGHQRLALSALASPHAAAPALFSAVTFGFLSFAGFEAASTLGEETRDPRRAIPRALTGTVLLAGGFFVFVTTAETLGYGTDAAGLARFTHSSSLVGDLAGAYISPGVGHLVTACAAVGAFGSALACAVSASRLLFAMGRDGFISPRLGDVRGPDGVPARALATVLAAVAVGLAGARVFATPSATDIFFWSATIGSLVLLLAYAFTLVGAVKYLFLSGPRRARPAELPIPVAGLLFIGYVLYANVHPAPRPPYDSFPYVAAAWLLAGVAAALVLRPAPAPADAASGNGLDDGDPREPVLPEPVPPAG